MVYIKVYYNLYSDSNFNYDNVIVAFLTPISIIHLYFFACFGIILNIIIKIWISGGFNSGWDHFISTIVQPLNIRGWVGNTFSFQDWLGLGVLIFYI